MTPRLPSSYCTTQHLKCRCMAHSVGIISQCFENKCYNVTFNCHLSIRRCLCLATNMCRSHFLSGGGIIYAVIMNTILVYSYQNEHLQVKSCLFFRPIKTISHCITICCPFSEKLVSHPGSATEVVFNYALCSIEVQLCTLQH